MIWTNELLRVVRVAWIRVVSVQDISVVRTLQNEGSNCVAWISDDLGLLQFDCDQELPDPASEREGVPHHQTACHHEKAVRNDNLQR